MGKLTDGVSDALELSRVIHRQMRSLQQSIYELEYLICELDDRCKIEFFKDQNDIQRRLSKRTKKNRDGKH